MIKYSKQKLFSTMTVLSAAQWDHLNSFSELRSNYYVRREEISESDVLWVKLIFIFPNSLPPMVSNPHGLKGDPSLSVSITNKLFYGFSLWKKLSKRVATDQLEEFPKLCII